MPFYDYRCTQCGQLVEVWHGIDGQGPAACDACGGAMKKALSTPAIHFKGSGWAKKDAQAASTAKTAKKDDEASGEKGSGDAAGATGGKETDKQAASQADKDSGTAATDSSRSTDGPASTSKTAAGSTAE